MTVAGRHHIHSIPFCRQGHSEFDGAGGEARQPLGLVVVGGLLFSQLVTLYLTPVVFIYLARLQAWLGHRSRRGEPIGLSEAPAK